MQRPRLVRFEASSDAGAAAGGRGTNPDGQPDVAAQQMNEAAMEVAKTAGVEPTKSASQQSGAGDDPNIAAASLANAAASSAALGPEEGAALAAAELAAAASGAASTTTTPSPSSSFIRVTPPGEEPATLPPSQQLSEPEEPLAALPAAGQTGEGAPPPPGEGGSGGDSGGAGPSSGDDEKRASEIRRLKQRLVEVVASLDRGVAATKDQGELVGALCRRLEAEGGQVVLSWDQSYAGGQQQHTPGNALLSGRWRLLYSSAFSTGSQGGFYPGPPFALSPFRLGQVYQDIDVGSRELDNVVDLIAKYSLADLPGLPQAENPTATARLRHNMGIIGTNTVEITFVATSVQLKGGVFGWLSNVPQIDLPGLQSLLGVPKQARSARFDVVFLDDDLRITRGDMNELRVFVRGEL
ncbi:hypothetical protein N2152v2_006281 [Parachlorella kessleri]